jgi:hypothetical protein
VTRRVLALKARQPLALTTELLSEAVNRPLDAVE